LSISLEVLKTDRGVQHFKSKDTKVHVY